MAKLKALEKTIQFYEKIKKGSMPDVSEWQNLTKEIKDESGEFKVELSVLTEEILRLKAEKEAYYKIVREKLSQIKDLNEEKKRKVEEVLAANESLLRGLQEGESVAIKITNGVGRVYGIIVVSLEKGKTYTPSVEEVLDMAMNIVGRKYKTAMDELRKEIDRLRVASSTVDEASQMLISVVIPDIKGIRTEVLRDFNQWGINSNLLLEISLKDLWDKFVDFWRKSVSFIKGVVASIFSLSRDVDNIELDVDALENKVNSL